MQAVLRKLDSLSLDPANVRRHGRENIELIKKSLAEKGQYRPLVVDSRTGVVRIGNGRLTAMRELGWTEAWVVEYDFAAHPGAEILDNRLNELSAWDDPGIDEWLLDSKGIDWWGVDIAKSYALLAKDKAARSAGEPPKPPKPGPVCPCCGKPIHRIRVAAL